MGEVEKTEKSKFVLTAFVCVCSIRMPLTDFKSSAHICYLENERWRKTKVRIDTWKGNVKVPRAIFQKKHILKRIYPFERYIPLAHFRAKHARQTQTLTWKQKTENWRQNEVVPNRTRVLCFWQLCTLDMLGARTSTFKLHILHDIPERLFVLFKTKLDGHQSEHVQRGKDKADPLHPYAMLGPIHENSVFGTSTFLVFSFVCQASRGWRNGRKRIN